MLRMGCCMGASHGGLLRSECHMGALTCHMCVTCAVSDLDRVALNSMTYGSPDSAGGALDGKEGGVYIYACVGATWGEARCCPHLPRPPRRPRPFSVIPPFLPSFSPLPPSRRPRSVCWGSGAPSTLPFPSPPPPACARLSQGAAHERGGQRGPARHVTAPMGHPLGCQADHLL